MKKARKKGSGRTKGATSFVIVTLDELNQTLKPQATVVISRRFAENVGITGKPFSATTKNIESHACQIEMTKAQDPEETVTFAKLTDW
jgi:hypothetical protein|tara:strand:+ start:1617 stop:1880 length:264 start_codon:yes stop_codon:yes gene_type:complete